MKNNVTQLKLVEKLEEKKEKEKTISFLREVIKNLELENLDPDDCIVLVSLRDKVDSIFNSESFDIFNTELTTKNMLGLMELARHKLLCDTAR